jgi:hypothetical protein
MERESGGEYAVHSEWQSRLDFLLVLAAIVVITLVVFKLLGPQVFALTQYLLTRIGDFFAAINSLIGGALGTKA